MLPRCSRLTLVLLPFVLAACHKATPLTAPVRTPAPPTVPARPAAPPPSVRPAVSRSPTAPLSEDQLFSRKSLDQLNAEHPLSDAFFAYDDNTVSDAARQSLQKDAQWLRRWPQTAIRIDGHCDERGTAEYNLALGNRRAQAVREYLTDLGISGNRIEVRTLGKEAPFCTSEADESCWAQNRRGHFVITAK